MKVTKIDLFTAAQNELAQMAKALAHPARIAIIQHLLKTNACINGDLVQELGLAQATISQHLRELKQIGIRTPGPFQAYNNALVTSCCPSPAPAKRDISPLKLRNLPFRFRSKRHQHSRLLFLHLVTFYAGMSVAYSRLTEASF